MCYEPAYRLFVADSVYCAVQGCWRKVVIDDLMPFDHDGNLLLPATSMPHELWPMLLTKALLKVAALESVIFYTSVVCTVSALCKASVFFTRVDVELCLLKLPVCQ